MTGLFDLQEYLEEYLKDRLFIDEVIRDNLILPKGITITKGYEVILPDGIVKGDLYNE